MELRDHRALWGISTSILQFFTFFLIQIILTPLILTYIGSETLGAFSIFMQFISYSILFDLGISTTLIRYLSQSYFENKRKFIDYFTTGKLLLIFINGFFVLLLVYFTIFPEKFIPLKDFGDRLDIQKSFLLLFIWFFFKGFFLIYNVGLTATQNLRALNLIILFSNLLRFFLSLFFIFNNGGLNELILSFVLGEFFSYSCQFIYFKYKILRKTKIYLLLDKSILKEYFSFGFIYWLINLSVLLFLNSDLILLGIFNTNTEVSYYYITKIPIFILMQIIFRFSDNYLPAFNELYIKNDTKKFIKTYFFILNLSFVSIIFIILGSLNYNYHVISFWVGREYYMGDFMTVFFSLFVSTQIINHLNAYILITTKKLKIWAIFSLIITVLGIPILFFISKNYDAIYMSFGLFIIDVPYLIFTFYSVIKILNLKVSLNFKKFLHFSFQIVILIIYFYIDDLIFDYNSVTSLFFSIMIVTTLYFFLINNIIYKFTNHNILWAIRKKFQF